MRSGSFCYMEEFSEKSGTLEIVDPTLIPVGIVQLTSGKMTLGLSGLRSRLSKHITLKQPLHHPAESETAESDL